MSMLGKTAIQKMYHRNISIAKIRIDNTQPRKKFPKDDLTRLSGTISDRGLINPIIVRQEKGIYKILAGERRFRAAEGLRLDEVSCLIVDAPLSEAEILEIQLIDNMLHEPLDPIDQAKAFERLMKLRGWNRLQLATNLHLSQAAVTKTLALLLFTDDVQAEVTSGNLSPSSAYAISRLPDPVQQKELAHKTIAENLPRDEVEAIVRLNTQKARQEPGPKKTAELPRMSATGIAKQINPAPQRLVSAPVEKGAPEVELVVRQDAPPGSKPIVTVNADHRLSPDAVYRILQRASTEALRRVLENASSNRKG